MSHFLVRRSLLNDGKGAVSAQLGLKNRSMDTLANTTLEQRQRDTCNKKGPGNTGADFVVFKTAMINSRAGEGA